MGLTQPRVRIIHHKNITRTADIDIQTFLDTFIKLYRQPEPSYSARRYSIIVLLSPPRCSSLIINIIESSESTALQSLQGDVSQNTSEIWFVLQLLFHLYLGDKTNLRIHEVFSSECQNSTLLKNVFPYLIADNWSWERERYIFYEANINISIMQSRKFTGPVKYFTAGWYFDVQPSYGAEWRLVTHYCNYWHIAGAPSQLYSVTFHFYFES